MATVSYYKIDSLPSPNPTPTPDFHSNTGYDPASFRPTSPSLKPEYPGYSYNSSPQTLSSSFGSPDPNASLIPLKPNSPNRRPAQGKLRKTSRWLRILQIATRAVTVLFSAIIFGIMAYITVEFQTTKTVIRNGRDPWAKNSKVWPTYKFLITSGITLLVSMIMLLAYCCCFEKARTSWKLTLLNYVIHLGVWITVTFLYRYEKSLHGKDNDLWGWACSNEATAIQTEFAGVVDFKAICTAQTSSWKVSIAECVAKVAFAIGHFVIYRKTRENEKQNLADGLGGAFSDLAEHAF